MSTVRRYVEIYFHMATGNFQVVLDQSDKVYTLSHIQGKKGPLEWMDLRIGGQIRVLGRCVVEWRIDQRIWRDRAHPAPSAQLHPTDSQR